MMETDTTAANTTPKRTTIMLSGTYQIAEQWYQNSPEVLACAGHAFANAKGNSVAAKEIADQLKRDMSRTKIQRKTNTAIFPCCLTFELSGGPSGPSASTNG